MKKIEMKKYSTIFIGKQKQILALSPGKIDKFE